MNLLLLLTALFASLTGHGPAEAQRQTQSIAVVQTAKVVQVAAQPARAIPFATFRPQGHLNAAKPLPMAASTALAGYYLPFERRLE